MITISDEAALFNRMQSYRVIIVEGARCTGKDFLIAKFTKTRPEYNIYEALKPRKQFLNQFTGGLNNLPGGLEIQQSHLWTLDVMRQLYQTKVIINRSMLTSLHFDGPNEERFTMWRKLVADMGAVVVLMQPSDRLHAKRIAQAGRSAEATSIYAEKTGIQRWASQLNKELIVFSETGA